jgi:hypothetical protein
MVRPTCIAYLTVDTYSQMKVVIKSYKVRTMTDFLLEGPGRAAVSKPTALTPHATDAAAATYRDIDLRTSSAWSARKRLAAQALNPIVITEQ